jgi:hypothetical protein
MHQPYQNRLKHPADFRVRYRFYATEADRLNLPYQGIRCDFQYDYPGRKLNEAFMIWPQFEDSLGNLILDNLSPVPREGTARMWILIPERRTFHREHLKVGLKCNFFEGKPTADCEVIEILGLMTNPDA